MSTTKKRKVTEEFKPEAVRLSEPQHGQVAGVGITTRSRGRWSGKG